MIIDQQDCDIPTASRLDLMANIRNEEEEQEKLRLEQSQLQIQQQDNQQLRQRISEEREALEAIQRSEDYKRQQINTERDELITMEQKQQEMRQRLVEEGERLQQMQLNQDHQRHHLESANSAIGIFKRQQAQEHQEMNQIQQAHQEQLQFVHLEELQINNSLQQLERLKLRHNELQKETSQVSHQAQIAPDRLERDMQEHQQLEEERLSEAEPEDEAMVNEDATIPERSETVPHNGTKMKISPENTISQTPKSTIETECTEVDRDEEQCGVTSPIHRSSTTMTSPNATITRPSSVMIRSSKQYGLAKVQTIDAHKTVSEQRDITSTIGQNSTIDSQKIMEIRPSSLIATDLEDNTMPTVADTQTLNDKEMAPENCEVICSMEGDPTTDPREEASSSRMIASNLRLPTQIKDGNVDILEHFEVVSEQRPLESSAKRCQATMLKESAQADFPVMREDRNVFKQGETMESTTDKTQKIYSFRGQSNSAAISNSRSKRRQFDEDKKNQEIQDRMRGRKRTEGNKYQRLDSSWSPGLTIFVNKNSERWSSCSSRRITGIAPKTPSRGRCRLLTFESTMCPNKILHLPPIAMT